MDVEKALKTALSHLQSDILTNEAQVKLAVILPVLRALDWDHTDPASFRPEYAVPSGAVDYALFDHGKPLVFIEAKRIGNLSTSGVEQVFKYANHQGVPFLVLTDGNRWDFYLSMAAGVPTERRFYRLELQSANKISEYAEFLREHLARDRVVSGQAKISAEKRHESNRERNKARRAIPDVWKNLLREPDETLRDLLAETVESECGTKPDLDDVEAFLRKFALPSSPSEPEPGPPPTPPEPEPRPHKPSQMSRIGGFVIRGEKVETRSARETLAALIVKFDREDSTFMERFYVASTTRSRRLVSRNRSNLYDKTHLAEHAMKLENGWWLGTNLSRNQIRSHIKTACTVAGIEFGKDLSLIER